jgi:hypothetical protein
MAEGQGKNVNHDVVFLQQQEGRIKERTRKGKVETLGNRF